MEKEETDSRSPYLQSLPVEKEVRVHQIKIKLASCHQDGKTIFDYYGRFCYLWDQLQLYRPLPVCCCPAQYEISKDREREQLHHFLMGLDARYGCLCTHLLGMDPLPSLGEAYSKVVSEEQKLSFNPTHEQQAAVGFVTPSLATAPSSCQQSDSSVLVEDYSKVSKETSPSDSAGLLVQRSSKMDKELDSPSSYSKVVSEEQKLSSNPTHEQQAAVGFVTPSLATAPSSCQQSDSSILVEAYSKVSKETSPSDSAGLLVQRSSKMDKELDSPSSYSKVVSEEQKLSSNPTHEQQAAVGFVTPSLATAPSSCQQSDSSVLAEAYSKVSKETSTSDSAGLLVQRSSKMETETYEKRPSEKLERFLHKLVSGTAVDIIGDLVEVGPSTQGIINCICNFFTLPEMIKYFEQVYPLVDQKVVTYMFRELIQTEDIGREYMEHSMYCSARRRKRPTEIEKTEKVERGEVPSTGGETSTSGT